MKRIKRTLLLLALLSAGIHAAAQPRVLINTDEDRLALEGYDPVGFFAEGKPVKGKAGYQLIYKGAVYQFDSMENLKAFRESPETYEPRFGGYCPVALSAGTLAPGSAQKFRIIDNRLYLVHDTEAADQMNEQRLDKAARQYRKKRQEKGQYYRPAGPRR